MTEVASIANRAAHVPIPEAARELGMSPRTLRRLLRAGAPQAVQGRRGRGRRALIDVAAVRTWRAAQRSPEVDFRVIAAEIPKILAAAAWRAFLEANVSDKRAIAGALGAAWYVGATSVRDYLSAYVGDIPEIAEAPEQIGHLMRHFESFR